MNNDLKLKLFSGISYNALTKIISLVFQLLANIILSRALSAKDYGIVGFAFIVINFLALFNDIGINSAVIHRKDLDDRALFTAFAIKAALGVGLFLIAFMISPLAPYFFEEGAVTNVLRILSLNLLINVFSFIPMALLRRELDYKKISFGNILSVIVGSSFAIVFALAGFKYWSIVLANLSGTVTLALAMNLVRPVRIKLYFDGKIAREFINYSWYIFVSNIIVFATFNGDNFLIGFVKGSSLLGYYAIAFNWGSSICDLLSGTILTVLFPTFSKIQSEKDKIKTYYLKVLEYISLIAVLANITLFIIAKEFLVFILGRGTEKWLPSLLALKILCFYGIFRALLEPVASVIMAIGKTPLMLKVTLLSMILELAFLYPALRYFSIEGVALVVTFAYVFQYILYIPFLKEELGIQPAELIKAVSPTFFSLIVVLAIYFSFEHLQFRSTKLLLVGKAVFSLLGFCVFYGIFTKWRILREARSLIGSIKRS